jgi:hypothetical protein
MAPAVGSVLSAAAGAAAVHVFGLLASTPAYQAMWTWTASPPRGGGWSCEQAVVGCTSWLEVGCDNKEFQCTVVPAAGYTCNETETTLACAPIGEPSEAYNGAIGIYNYCQDVGSVVGGPANSYLFWSPEPSCTKGGSSLSQVRARPHAPVPAADADVHDGVHFIQKPTEPRKEL